MIEWAQCFLLLQASRSKSSGLSMHKFCHYSLRDPVWRRHWLENRCQPRDDQDRAKFEKSISTPNSTRLHLKNEFLSRREPKSDGLLVQRSRYEKGSLTPCPGNEGVLAMSKTSWGSLFGPFLFNNSGYRQQNLLIARTWTCVPVMSKFLCLCPEFECNLGPKREPHRFNLLTTRTPSFAGHEVRLPVSW